MGDLISRSALIEVLNKWADANAERGYDTAYDLVKECIEVVKERPTAYDVEKVVEELESDERHTFDGCINKRYTTEIVRKGGVE